MQHWVASRLVYFKIDFFVCQADRVVIRWEIWRSFDPWLHGGGMIFEAAGPYLPFMYYDVNWINY